jgi:hypothetical protein
VKTSNHPAPRGAVYTKGGKRVTKLSLARSRAAGIPVTELRTARGNPIRGKALTRRIAEIEKLPSKRAAFRISLSGYNLKHVKSLPLKEQDIFKEIFQKYPEEVPKNISDPFAGSKRGSLWRLYYSSRDALRH